MRTCPYTGSNAISLAYCALYTAIPLVHVPGFRCQADAMQARLGRLHIDESRWININSSLNQVKFNWNTQLSNSKNLGIDSKKYDRLFLDLF